MIRLFNYIDLKSPRELYFELGLSIAKKGFNYSEKGIEFLKVALQENKESGSPTDAEIYIALGNLFLQRTNEAEAIKNYLNAAASSSNYFCEILEGVEDYLNKNNIDSLKEWIWGEWKPRIESSLVTESMEKSLTSFWARYNLYTANYEKALSLYQLLWANDTENFRVLEGLGETNFFLNDFIKAEKFLIRARKIAKDSIKIKKISLTLINFFIRSGSYQKGLNEIKNYKKNGLGQDNTLMFLESQALRGIWKFREAIEILNNLIKFLPQKIEYYLEIIENYIALNDYQKSNLFVDRAFQIESINKDLLFLKIQNLIEGQLDIEEGKRLFIEEKHGLLFTDGEKKIMDKIELILNSRYEDGNAYFFAAYIIFLIYPNNEKINDLVEKVESLGLFNESEYPKIGLYLLKGEIAEETGDKSQAAIEFFEAAKCYYWQTNNNEAKKYLEKAISLNSELSKAKIYYADTLFILSVENVPPYNNKDLINKSYDVWHSAHEKVVKSKYDAWHYIVIARIHEACYKFSKNNYYEDFWNSVLYTERALIHDRDNISIWTYLGRFYRNLELEVNGLAAFERAESLNEDDEFLKEEKVMLQLNMGEYEKPSEFLNTLKKKEKSSPNIYKSHHKSWEGFIIFQKNNQFNKAIRLFDEIIKETNHDLFTHQMKMVCQWRANHMEEAKIEARVILRLENKYSFLKEDFTFAWANFICGDFEKAITILEYFNLQANTTINHSNSLSQFYLFSGQESLAKAAFADFINWTYNRRHFEELFYDLDALEFQFKNEMPEAGGSLNNFQEIIKSWREQITIKLAYISKTPLSAMEELKSAVDKYRVENGSIAYIAIQVGLARIARDANNFPEAIQFYKALRKHESQFPEVDYAIEQLEDEVFTLARSAIKASGFVEAIKYLHSFDDDIEAKAITKYTLLSLAYYGSGDEEKSFEYLKTSLSLVGINDESKKQFWEEITTTVYNPGLTWDYGYFLKTNMEHLQENEAEEMNQLMVKNFWNVLINKKNDLFPVVTPVAIEISRDLISPNADSADWYVIKDLIPAMRERIFKRYGIKPAGVRIRGNEGDLTTGTYIIMLDEVPLVMGTVKKDKLFITKTEYDLQALGIKGERSLNPCSGEEAHWVSLEYKNLLNENNLSYREDYFDYILAHLEAVLVRNLDMFIDTQFCEDYLDTVANISDVENSKLLIENAKIINTESTLLVLFNEVLKGLLREKVPIINKEIIIRSFMSGKDICNDISELIQYLRIKLKKELPVNNLQIHRIELPNEIEKNIAEELQHEQGKVFLAMTPDNCQQALADIRRIIEKDSLQENLILLTKDSQLRIHLRKLVELEFPNFVVASQEELIKIIGLPI